MSDKSEAEGVVRHNLERDSQSQAFDTIVVNRGVKRGVHPKGKSFGSRALCETGLGMLSLGAGWFLVSVQYQQDNSSIIGSGSLFTLDCPMTHLYKWLIPLYTYSGDTLGINLDSGG